jgi:hypothetical protein
MSTTRADFAYATARVGDVLCEGQCTVRAEDVQQFRALMGYPATENGQVPVAPTSMGLTYGLRLGWEHQIFPAGAIRVGDDDVFGVAAQAGDELLTQFRIVETFERKGRKFMKYEMRTANQRDELVCSVSFTAVVP